MLQRSPSVIEPGGLEGGGIESGFLKNGDRRGGSFTTSFSLHLVTCHIWFRANPPLEVNLAIASSL